MKTHFDLQTDKLKKWQIVPTVIHNRYSKKQKLFNNICRLFIKGTKGNFQKMPRRYVDSMGSPYDLGSVMHYGGYSFSKNRKPTILNA